MNHGCTLGSLKNSNPSAASSGWGKRFGRPDKKWGFPKITGTILGALIKRTIVFGDI